MVYIFVGDWRELNTVTTRTEFWQIWQRLRPKGPTWSRGFDWRLWWNIHSDDFTPGNHKNTSHRMHRFCLTCHWFPSNHFLAGFIWKGNINAFKNLHLISWPWYVSYFRRLGEFTARRPKAHKADSKAVINFNFIYICNFAVHYCHYLIPQTSCSNHIEETQGTGPGVQAHAVCSSTSKYYHWNGMIWM